MKEVEEVIKGLDLAFIFTGHSLGGTAAMCLAKKYTNSRAVAFNPGAVASNPFLDNPRATVYHIVGDLISSHVDAGKVIRISLGRDSFGTWQHYSKRFYEPGKIVDADYEDRVWMEYRPPVVTSQLLASAGLYLASRKLRKVPIPGSERWKKMQ